MKFVIAALLLAVNLVSCADEIPRDTVRVDRSDPKFVTASLVVFGPGDELFSCVGHACIRMECPTFELDRCFSYESERIVAKITAFFMGKLNMGLFSVASDEFFAEYRDGGRGATQYQLNLTPAAKQRLWKILDDKVAEGANLPYDYNRRGCAKSACEAIMAALKGERVQCAFWNPNVSPTRREKFCEELFASSPWNLFCLNAIVGTEVDNVEEVVTPKDLLAFLRKTHVNGIPILTDGGREILPAQPRGKASWLTPLVAAALLAALCAANVFFRFGWFDAVILILQGLCGAFFLYLMSASRLPTSCWNWLVVPFNPIAPLLWWLRPRWSLWFVGILLAWETLMVASTHPLTDRAFLLLAIALMITYAKRGLVVCVRR